MFFVALLLSNGYEDNCSPFHEIYSDGQDLCESMWGDAFVVVDDDQSAYTMWFFDEINPNNDVTDTIFGAGTFANITECHLQYFHKDAPGPESDDFVECHPWKNNACCHQETVPTDNALRIAYGAGYEWDRCGPMTAACERFFVQEACFYECEPSAGLFRKYTNKNHPDYNEWEMSGMPIKRSYCDAWYTACYNDYFCGTGNYFSCAAEYWENLAANSSVVQNETIIYVQNETVRVVKEDNDSDYPWEVIIILVVIVVFVVGVVIYMVTREKQGNPVFSLLHDKRNPESAEMTSSA